jgi:hypothetical protein
MIGSSPNLLYQKEQIVFKNRGIIIYPKIKTYSNQVYNIMIPRLKFFLM